MCGVLLMWCRCVVLANSWPLLTIFLERSGFIIWHTNWRSFRSSRHGVLRLRTRRGGRSRSCELTMGPSSRIRSLISFVRSMVFNVTLQWRRPLSRMVLQNAWTAQLQREHDACGWMRDCPRSSGLKLLALQSTWSIDHRTLLLMGRWPKRYGLVNLLIILPCASSDVQVMSIFLLMRDQSWIRSPRSAYFWAMKGE